MVLSHLLLILTLVYRTHAECVFPQHFQDTKWYYRISVTESTRTEITFTDDVMTFVAQQLPSEYVVKKTSYECKEMVDVNKYILQEYDDNIDGVFIYKCLEIIERSKSIMQFRDSGTSTVSSRALCDEDNLMLDPWIIVSYGYLESDYSPCPLNAGYNMKISDKNGNEHGCNFMDLPMRFESDCLSGEGIILDFRKYECTDILAETTQQKTICVTHWNSEDYIFTVVRKHESGDIWCLRFPSRRVGNQVKADLFIDIICPYDPEPNRDLDFVNLYLTKVVQSNLCADEYPQCKLKPCMTYIRDQCHKSCGKCKTDEPLPICSFPRRFRGEWYLGTDTGAENINISESVMQIGSIGNFKCVVFEDSPSAKERMYTTVSTFDNGCRPRYTCLDMKRLSPSVIGFAISQNFVWPLNDDNPGKTICSNARFEPDVDPIGDRYRSLPNAVKPILPVSRRLEPTSCHLKSVLSFIVQTKSNTQCRGRMFQDCKNSSLLRMEFDRCRDQPEDLNFVCVASFKGRYWEKLLILVNFDDKYDSKCLAFTTLRPSEALLLHSSQCDMYAWSYYDAGIRPAYLHFTTKEKEETCRDIPFPTTLALPAVSEANQMLKTTEAFAKHLPNPSLMRDGNPTPSYTIQQKPSGKKNIDVASNSGRNLKKGELTPSDSSFNSADKQSTSLSTVYISSLILLWKIDFFQS